MSEHEQEQDQPRMPSLFGKSKPQPSELTEALAAVQKKVQSVGTNQTADAGKYKYKYADLASIIAKVYPIMAENGLAWTALPTVVDGHMVLRYQLRHKSGEVLEGMYPLATHGTPQQMGSEISYARRYTFSAVIGIATEEDDDGKRASEAPQDRPAAKTPAKKAPASQGPSEPQRKKLHALIGEIGMSRDEGLAFMAGWIGHEISTTNELTVAEASTVIDKLQIMRDTELREDGIDPETGEYV